MRLTYKYEKSSGYGSVKLKNLPNDPFVDKLPYLDDAWQEQRNKLGQLEDIEEELGIDLLTLFKALKNGIYYKLEDGKYIKFNGACLPIKPHKLNINMKNKSLSIGNDNYYFKDYGKTWALTKEELL